MISATFGMPQFGCTVVRNKPITEAKISFYQLDETDTFHVLSFI